MNIYTGIERNCYECGKVGGLQVEFGHATRYPRVLCNDCIGKMHEMLKETDEKEIMNTEGMEVHYPYEIRIENVLLPPRSSDMNKKEETEDEKRIREHFDDLERREREEREWRKAHQGQLLGI